MAQAKLASSSSATALAGAPLPDAPSSERAAKRSMHAPASKPPTLKEALVVAAALAAGAWASRDATPDSADPCGLERLPASAALRWRRPPPRPVVLAPFAANDGFRRRTARAPLLERLGESRVVLTSSNSYSEHELATTLRAYVEDHVPRHASDAAANESYYLFGPQFDAALEALVESYAHPACGGAWCARDAFAASFGLAGARSGVSFHTHGSGFGEVLHGRKRWIQYPPGDAAPPGFDPDGPTRRWVDDVLPTLRGADLPVHDCVLGPGELLYFPPRWWHATLNLDDHTVFVSSFASDHALEADGGGDLRPGW